MGYCKVLHIWACKQGRPSRVIWTWLRHADEWIYDTWPFKNVRIMGQKSCAWLRWKYSERFIGL